MIPMVDLKEHDAQLKHEIERGIAEVIENCAFILGPNVRAFEQEAAAYLGVKHAVACASGTDALHLALLAAGIGAGDEVITSAFTFIATAEAISYVGATPVFVDIDPRTFNITASTIEPAINAKTKAIVPVHLFGQPADITAIKSLCEQYQLKLIEDCAQSFGARIGGKHSGSIGDVSGFSFFPSKNLGAYGDAGLVVTDNDATAKQLKMLCNHGSDVRYHHDIVGYNSRLDEIQAVVLRAKLKKIDQYNQARRRVAHAYSKQLQNLPLTTPYEDGLGEHVYHQYTLLGDDRCAVMQALQQQHIACAIYYPVPLHQQNVFQAACQELALPVTEHIASRCFSLPIFPSLSDAAINTVVSVIASAVKR